MTHALAATPPGCGTKASAASRPATGRSHMRSTRASPMQSVRMAGKYGRRRFGGDQRAPRRARRPARVLAQRPRGQRGLRPRRPDEQRPLAAAARAHRRHRCRPPGLRAHDQARGLRLHHRRLRALARSLRRARGAGRLPAGRARLGRARAGVGGAPSGGRRTRRDHRRRAAAARLSLAPGRADLADAGARRDRDRPDDAPRDAPRAAGRDRRARLAALRPGHAARDPAAVPQRGSRRARRRRHGARRAARARAGRLGRGGSVPAPALRRRVRRRAGRPGRGAPRRRRRALELARARRRARPRGALRRVRPAIAIAALIAAAYLVVAPESADLAAQLYRAELFDRHGWLLWDNAWYGGHPLPGYSVLFPPLGALIGVRLTGALSAVAAAALFAALVRDAFPARRAGLGAAAFAALVAAQLLTGRMTFLLGVALGLGALLAYRRHRTAHAIALAALTTLAS